MRADDKPFADRVQRVREFNRFYTRYLGLLNEGLYGSRFTLAEVRVLFELTHRRDATATLLCASLGMDAGFLSRILRRFEKAGLIRRKRSQQDGRHKVLSVTPRGRSAFAPLDVGANRQVASLLGQMSATSQERLLGAMTVVRELMEDTMPSSA